jgi:hypothetical protein
MQMQSNIGKTLSKTEAFAKREKEGGFPSMKGNIGPTSKLNFEKDNSYHAQQKQLFSKMADEFAIDKIIPDHKNQKNLTKEGNNRNSAGSFNLSIDNEEIKSYNNSSEHNKS